MAQKLFVAVYLIQKGQVLLGLKARKIAKGLWVGFGGSLEKEENSRAAAVREAREELGVTIFPADLEGGDTLEVDAFDKEGKPAKILLTLFRVRKWEGDPVCNEEFLETAWFPINALPANIPAGDRAWLSFFLDQYRVSGCVEYASPDLSDVVKAEILITA